MLKNTFKIDQIAREVVCAIVGFSFTNNKFNYHHLYGNVNTYLSRSPLKKTILGLIKVLNVKNGNIE